MPIELRCPGCQKLLRVPDAAAGKHARCPECQQVVSVPTASSSPFSDAPGPAPSMGFPSPAAPVAAPTKSDSFRDAPSGTSGSFRPATDPTNPYAASGFYEAPKIGEVPGAVSLTHQRISFDEVINMTWAVFQQHIGPLAIVGLFVFGINAVQQGIGFGVGLLNGTINDPVFNIVSNLGLQVLGLLVQPIIMLGTMVPCLKLMRTGHTIPGDFMGFTRYYGTCLLKDFLIYLVMGGAMLMAAAPTIVLLAMQQPEGAMIVGLGTFVVLIVPMIWVSMGILLSTLFIADRGAGAIDSLKLSWDFMNGNRGAAFLLSLVVGLVGGLFACCTLGFGTIVLTPFISLMWTIIYLLATGQRSTISPSVLGPPAVPPGNLQF
jgi:hypothetical protein